MSCAKERSRSEMGKPGGNAAIAWDTEEMIERRKDAAYLDP